uniref:hematopoietic prostaglandin D synthase-like n=1 Tax=Styela clava TaxID=7725 RepID=UPI001939EE3D|nr:hematopoietic prostaglandin D synthase-like [Styela clava]
MVQYKLYYFDARGNAEIIRLIFAYSDVKYEDVRIPREEWPKHKSDMPLRQLPVLEVDGVKLCQSATLNRYMAREFGLMGKTSKDAYYIEMFCDSIMEIVWKYPFMEEDEKKKAARAEEFKKTTPESLSRLQKMIEKCSHEGEWIFGTFTLADLYLFTFGDFVLPVCNDIFSSVPEMQKIYEKVKSLPKIAAWIEKRPVTFL